MSLEAFGNVPRHNRKKMISVCLIFLFLSRDGKDLFHAREDKMKRSAQRLSRAHKIGHFIGFVIRRCLSIENGMKYWLIGKGMNPSLCKWLFRILKLGLIGLALYISFWIAVVLAGLWIFKGMGDLDLIPEGMEKDEGWQHGHAGFGYYVNGYRVDPGRCDDE